MECLPDEAADPMDVYGTYSEFVISPDAFSLAILYCIAWSLLAFTPSQDTYTFLPFEYSEGYVLTLVAWVGLSLVYTTVSFGLYDVAPVLVP